MKWFKRKYKKNAWFEGLLLAERLIQEGYVVNSVYDEPLWFVLTTEGEVRRHQTIGYTSNGRKDGAIDYLKYFYEKLK